MVCIKCDGKGFHWKIERGIGQTSYGQDVPRTAYKRGDTCEECKGLGRVETKLTLTGFGWLLIIGIVAAIVVLGQFWPEL